ncbi:MAG: helicase [Desulfobulbus propionicus]|nr:MAG: helicase [Desulfobulbus propionicus]
MQLVEEYLRFTDKHVFLTGKAGTGKTTFLKGLKETSPKRMVVVAPTGVAAINAGGVTLHSFFGLPFGPFVPGSDSYSGSRYHRLSREKLKIIKSLDLLVIDEISMVRADMLDAVDHVLRTQRRNNQPFGGVQLLMVGDLQQLAPVVTANEQPIIDQYYASPYFFSSHALNNAGFIGIELTQIYRQTDTAFIQLLNNVRNNCDINATLAQLNAQYVATPSLENYSGYITLCTHNRQADAINTDHLRSLNTDVRHFSAEIEGEFPENAFPAAQTLELKVGAQVMFIRNDISPEKRYFNGKIGTVSSIGNTEICVVCEGDNEPVTVEQSSWENKTYLLDAERGEITETVIGSFVQFPLRLAWAVTIHKSQGLTFDKVIIDAQAAFSHGQVYVALSRCRTLDGIVLRSRLSQDSLKPDARVTSFSQQVLGNPEQHQAQLEQEKNRYQQRLLLECFDYSKLDRLLSRFIGLNKRYANQVQVFGCEDIEALQGSIRSAIVVVGQNFGRQLQGLFNDDQLPCEDGHILERITRASAYFTQKLDELYTAPFAKMHFETDNKEVNKQLRKAQDALEEEAGMKIAGAASCKKSFSPEQYLRALSAAAVAFSSAGTSARKKQNEPVYTEEDVTHAAFFTQLKKWRTDKARELGVPAFHILHQKTLVQVAVHLPDTIKALQTVKGIGPVTAERFGEELITMAQKYRRDNHIDTVVLPLLSAERKAVEKKQEKSTKSTKKTKDISLEMFEQGMSIAEIARERGMVTQTIEGHMAHWVAVGKVDIYKLVDAARVAHIKQVFQQAGTTPLRNAKEALGDEYGYGELTLVRSYLEYIEKEKENQSDKDKS